jgi:hypothetical protein
MKGEDNKTLICCPEKEGTELKLTAPFKKSVIIPGNQWVELKEGGVIPVIEEIQIFKK